MTFGFRSGCCLEMNELHCNVRCESRWLCWVVMFLVGDGADGCVKRVLLQWGFSESFLWRR